MNRHIPAETVADYLEALKKSQKFGPQVVYHKIIPEISPSFFPKQAPLSATTLRCVNQKGIEQLYTHQGKALELIGNEKNIIVATPTSSGKSMVYNLPVLERVLKDEGCHALYLFPLKALAQDQLKSLHDFSSLKQWGNTNSALPLGAIYDGDTSPYMRRKIREHTPPIVITNPEMLHLSFLPFHENWAHFFRKLEFVVIDEVHTYRGIFGSHVAWLIRRLKRILHHYGQQPRFILSSATIGNPRAFSENLIGETFEVITESGAPQSRKNFVFLNPWDSIAYAAGQLLEAALKRGLRTIVYTQSRKMTELISLWTRPNLGNLAERLSSYRAGFLPEERREIEQKLSDGSLLGVISTSALELGIDIGDLDLCILVGYPGSIMASWQRGGRVGRAGQESAVILLGGQDALDQYYMNNPENFFEKEVESAVLNPSNPKTIQQHLPCAAAELPLDVDEDLLREKNVMTGLRELTLENHLLQSADGRKYFSTRKRPQRHVNLRGSGTTLTIINETTGQILGEVDAGRALKECHEGAVYLHRVATWLVKKLDLAAQEVVVTEKKPPYYTRPMSNKDTEILRILQHSSLHDCSLSYGELKVTERVTGYQKRNNGTNRLINTTSLDLPEQVLETEGFWFEIPQNIVESFEKNKLHFMGSIHALEHLLISVFPLLVLCDRNDIGGISCPHHEQTEGASIFIYDGTPGGSGISAEAFEKAEQLFKRAMEVVNECGCDTGCPSCVHSPKCGSGNRPIDKNGCISLIHAISTNPRKKETPAKGHTAKKKSSADKTVIPITAEPKTVDDGVEVLPERWGVFDLETKYSAEEVGGWHRADKMGLSVGVVYDSTLDGCVSYLEHEADRLIDHLLDLDLIVGFNNRRFDNRVLSAYGARSLPTHPTLDLLEIITRQLGYRLSLDRIAEHTLGTRKSGDGLQALQWFRDGEMQKLTAYCRRDVEITRDVFLYGLENGFLLFQNKAKQKVRLPLLLAKAVLKELK